MRTLLKKRNMFFALCILNIPLCFCLYISASEWNIAFIIFPEKIDRVYDGGNTHTFEKVNSEINLGMCTVEWNDDGMTPIPHQLYFQSSAKSTLLSPHSFRHIRFHHDYFRKQSIWVPPLSSNTTILSEIASGLVVDDWLLFVFIFCLLGPMWPSNIMPTWIRFEYIGFCQYGRQKINEWPEIVSTKALDIHISYTYETNIVYVALIVL